MNLHPQDFNPPAFPVVGAVADNQFNGMSLRDYLAAKAPITLWDAMGAKGLGDDLRYQLQHQQMGSGHLFAAHAELCYMHADAMLAERAKAEGGAL